MDEAKLQSKQAIGKSVILRFYSDPDRSVSKYLAESSIPECTISPRLAPIEDDKFTVIDCDRTDGPRPVVIEA